MIPRAVSSTATETPFTETPCRQCGGWDTHYACKCGHRDIAD
jgi:hypothetical protein